MGIQTLLPFLANSTRDAHISEFENKFVAIDAYCWLHKSIYSCAFELAMKKPTRKYVVYCMRYIEMLLHFRVKPIIVFDGRHLISKSDVEKKRREDRRRKYLKGKELLRAGKLIDGRKFLEQSVDVTHELALNLMKECRRINVDCIVAPYEADSQLAFFSLRNIVDCIVTEDSDLLVYGCDKVMFKMDTSGRGKLVEKSLLHLSLNMTPEEFSEDLFRYMCILSGCDYLPSIPSIGVVNALKFVKMLKGNNIYEALPKLPIYVNKMNVKVPPEYITGFKIAENTFKHQLVYNPLLRQQEPLRPVQNDDDIVGTKLPDDLAFELAVGNIDPISMKKLDNYDPDKTGTGFKLIWKTDALPNATSKNLSSVSPKGKKRLRENLESDSVNTVTNNLKKPRTPVAKTAGKTAKAFPNFKCKTAITEKDLSDSKLSRYFTSSAKLHKPTENPDPNDRRKDESYEDYCLRLLNEFFPENQNENEKSLSDSEECSCESNKAKICYSCKKCRACCKCFDKSLGISQSEDFDVISKNSPSPKRLGRKSPEAFILDIIEKKEEKKEEIATEKEKEKEKESNPVLESPSQSLSINFAKILSKFDTEKTNDVKNEVEKENVVEVVNKTETPLRTPSPVFKVQKETRVLKKNSTVVNVLDTVATPTSVYFSSKEGENVEETKNTSKSSQQKARSYSSLRGRKAKPQVKPSVNKTLFQFGFQKK